MIRKAISLARNKKSENSPPVEKKKRRLNQLVERNLIRQVSYLEYRNKVREVYSGPQGALLSTASKVSLHLPLGERLFKEGQFDLSGAKSILDVGSGAGQMVQHLLKYSDPGTNIVGFDLSHEMLRRARNRVRSAIPSHVVADLAHLPFAEGTFDRATCGYVLEYLPDPRSGLAELRRVMAPGGRLLLLATEDSFSGAWTSRLWYCQTLNRRELRQACADVGLTWKKELWFTRMHKVFRAGGICVELEKEA